MKDAENSTVKELLRGGMIVGILDREDSSIQSFFSSFEDCSTHEKLKRNSFDDPICWRWNRNGFDSLFHYSDKLTEKETDLIYDHIREKYGFNPVDFLKKYYYY